MKKFKIYIIAFLLLVPFMFISNVNAKTIAELRKELNEIEEREKENNEDIKLTESEISGVRNEISQIYREIDTINENISAAEKEIEELGVKIEEKDESTKKMLSTLQQTEGNSFYLEYIFGADTITDFIYRYALAEQITEYNSDLIDEMTSLIKQNEDKKIELKNEQEELRKRQNSLSVKLTTLNNSKVKLYELGSSIEQEIQNARDIIKMYIDIGCSENDDISVCANKTLPPDTKFWRPFISGYLTSEFGYRDAIYSGGRLISSSGLHEGVDLSNGLGRNNPIYSVANGKVAGVWTDVDKYGNVIYGGLQVAIHHVVNGVTYTSSYAHLSRALVKTGDIVTKDTVIGMMGASGSATGYHLHLSISTGLRFTEYQSYSAYAARCVNPRNLINFPRGENAWYNRTTFYG